MNRLQLFEQPLPSTKEEALAWLRNLQTLGLDYHLDDSPDEIIVQNGQRLFRIHEIVYLEQLVPVLNALFIDEVAPDERDRINSGAWQAVEQAWSDPMEQTESVRKVIDRIFEQRSAGKIHHSFSPDRSRLTISIPLGMRWRLQNRGKNGEVWKDEWEFFEPLIANSELEWVSAEQTGDMTDAPMLGVLDEEGNVVERWAFMDYQVVDILDQLAETGHVVLHGGAL